MQRLRLEAIVFLCGAVIMMLELTGIRIIAPYFGTSMFVWTSMIGVILAALSLGYWLGGKAADRRPSYTLLSVNILVAALLTGAITILEVVVLPLVQTAKTDIRLGSLLVSILLFGPPSLLLAAVTPFAVRLRITGCESSGRTVGILYACSTLGSLVGTFLTGFVLFLYVGSTKIILLLSVILIVAALIASPIKVKKTIAAIIIVIFASLGQYLHESDKPAGLVADQDTLYARIWITDQYQPQAKRVVRLLKTDVCGEQGGMALGPEKEEESEDPFDKLERDLGKYGQIDRFEYFKFFRLGYHFNQNQQRSLMIGGGAYVFPRDYLMQFPKAEIDVVEIDEGVTELAKTYFGLRQDSRLNIIHEDGRVYLNRSSKKYDSIMVDVFTSYCSVPFHLTTREAISRMYDLLSPEGVVVVNLISALEGPKASFLQAELRTYSEVFPQAYAFAMESPNLPEKVQNVLVVALKGSSPPALNSSDPELNTYLQRLWKGKPSSNIPVLTDDFAPVESYAMRLM